MSSKSQKTNSSKGTIECNYCHSLGHKKAKCPVLSKKKRGVRECFYCKKTGHLINDCHALKAKQNRVCNSCGQKGHVRNKCPNKGTMFMFLSDDFKKQATVLMKSGKSKNSVSVKVSANSFAALEEADEVRIKLIVSPQVVAAAALQGSWCQKPKV